MKKVVIFLIISNIILLADSLPKMVKSAIVSIDGDKIGLSEDVPEGRGGIIIHNYGKGIFAIVNRAISLGGKSARVEEYLSFEHDAIPTIETKPKVGDSVIFGNLYKNITILAPDREIYDRVAESLKGRVLIHPDVYAYYMVMSGADKITLESLKNFAVANQVGLVLVVRGDEVRVLDPISKRYISKLPMKISKSQQPEAPFYARFEQMESSIFSSGEREFEPYYKGIEGIK